MRTSRHLVYDDRTAVDVADHGRKTLTRTNAEDVVKKTRVELKTGCASRIEVTRPKTTQDRTMADGELLLLL
jgi:hypothetical protein